MSKEFVDFLARRAEQFDEEIIKQLNPKDVWVGQVSCHLPRWWKSREAVRLISEGAAFRNSKPIPWEADSRNDSVEHTIDRFDKVFPDLKESWENK